MNELSNVFNQELQKLHNLKNEQISNISTEIEENQVTEKLMTTKELASVLGVSERTIRDTAKNKGVEGTFHTLKTKGGTQSVKVYTEEQATLIKQEIQKQQKWYTIEDLASMCGMSVETLKHGEKNLSVIMRIMSVNFEVNTRLGGYHNTKKFYSENVLKALKEYQIKNSVQNAVKEKAAEVAVVVTVKELANDLNVAESTIKNNINELRQVLGEVKKNNQGGYLLTEKQATLIKLKLRERNNLKDNSVVSQIGNNLEKQEAMTVKQVAETFEVSPEAIKQVVRKLFPNKMQNGKTTYLNEQEIACISKEMKTSYHLAMVEPTRLPCRLETTTELEVLANAASALTQLQELYNRKEAEYKSIIAQQQPKADYYDKFIDSSNLIEIGHLGKSTGIGEQKIFKRLVAEGYIKVRYSTDGVKYYDPCYGFEKYFKSVSVPFLRGEKQLNREKLMLTSDGYAYFMKKMGA